MEQYRKPMNGRVRTLVWTIAIGILWAGCSPGEREPTTIAFWAFGAEGENVQKLMPEFERRNPGLRVRVQMVPWTAAHEKLLTAYASNSTPDICQLGNTWIPELKMLDGIEPLNPWIDRSRTINDTSYFPGIWDTNILDSLVYGIPWYVDTRVLFYRSDLLAEAGYPRPPSSWSEWFDLCAKLKRLHPDEYAVFFSTHNEFAPPLILGLQKGAKLLRDGNLYGDFSAPEFRDALRTFHTFFAKGWAPTKTAQIVNVYQSFAEGFFAMYITGPWNIGEFIRRLPPEMQDKWMTAPLPGPEGGVGASLAGGASLVMFKNSKYKPEVWKLIEYLSEPEVQLEFYHRVGDLPARKEAWGDSTLRTNRYATAFFEQLKNVVATPKIPEWEQIAQKLREYAELVSMDVMTVDAATTALDRAVDLILEKRRWVVEHAK
jgi:multiple sugar transport system substrate-binding protein